MRKPKLNRKTYDMVKRMDHGQMKSFCANLYAQGYEEGKRSSEGLSDEKIKQEHLRIEDVGEEKACDIVVALARAKERKALTNG